MNSRTQSQIWRLLLISLLILVSVLQSPGATTPTARAAAPNPPPAAPTNTQIETFDDLPLGLAPAIAQALSGDLPDSYHLRATEGGYQAGNPAHDLTTTFIPTGPRITISGETWGLTLTGLGRGSAVRTLPAPQLAADGPRIEYRYPGLVEWYLNTNWGLEQGFTLRTPPAGRGDLALELEMSGSLRATQDGDATLQLSNAAGRPIARYTGLYAYDANGKDLPVRLTIRYSLLAILVDDTNAAYPITIDPWVQRAKLLPSDGAAGDYFGESVAISGDTVVVGARYNDDNGDDSGSAYVFEMGSSWNNMTQTAKLLPSDGAAGNHFGYPVAIDGDTVVVGAHRVGTGRVYVFEKPGGGWSGTLNQSATLLASDGVANDTFGVSVDIEGDIVIVGALYDDDGGINSGSAYVFEKPGGGWSGTLNQSAKLVASDDAANDRFGSVSISGDTVAVGAYGDDDNGSWSGSAYIFVEPGGGWSGTLNQTAKLLPSDGAIEDFFGITVVIRGDTVVAGAYGDDDNGTDSGSAYIFEKPGSGWSGTVTQTAKLLPSDGAADDGFGARIAFRGNTVVFGVQYDDDNGADSGSVYIFEKPGGGWSGTVNQSDKLLPSDGAADDRFGRYVSISADAGAIAVGACLNDDNGADSGSAYVFELVPSITKSVSSELLNPGDALTYTLDFYSGITATSVLITDVIPAQLASYTYTSTGALITSTGGTDYVWQVQDLYPGDSGVITITGVVSPDLASGYAFSNTAAIDSSESGEQSSVIVRVPFWVTGVEPDPKSNYASLDTNLTITLNESISQSTVTSRTIVVHGGFQGHLDGNISFGSIIYDPGNDLHPGEIVQTSVTTGVLSQDDVSIWPYVWQFRTAAGIGPVIFDHFIDSFGVASDETRSVVYGDVDGDGDLDLVVGNVSGQNLVYLNDGGVQGGTPGTFDNITRTFGTGSDSTYSVALGDVDEDGDLDIVVGNNGQNVVYLNDGDGTFDTTANTFGTGSDYTLSIALGDVDGDGDLDIAAGNWNSQQNVLYLNNGGVQGGTPGTFDTIAHNFGTGSDRTYSVALGDMDGDGDLDIAVGNWDEPNVIYLNDGDVWSGTPGTFDNTSHNFGTGSDDTTKIALGDVDDDGDLDIAVGNSNEQNRVYLNDNDGTFDTTTHDFGTGGDTTWSTALGDVDGDGDLDLVAGNWNGQNVIYLNDSDGTFDTITRTFGTGSDSTLDMALGDVDGDGDLDITVGNWTSHQSANYLNEALADLAIAKTTPAGSAVPGQAITYTLTFSNASGDTATGVVISDSIPVSVTGSTVISSGVAITQTSPGYVWAVQDLAQGEGGVITITGTLSEPLAAGVFTNTATITTTASDSAPGNNASSAGVDVIAPPSLIVDSLADGDDGDYGPGENTLREAIAYAGPGDTVTFDAGLSGGTIALGGTELSLTKTLTIQGSVPITVSGGYTSRVFDISESSVVTLSHLTIIHGYPGFGGDGGGIQIRGSTLTLLSSWLHSNLANKGGAIYNNGGVLKVGRSTLSDNQGATGGGVHNLGTLTVTHSTFSGNNAGGQGGGIYNSIGTTSTVTLIHSTLTGNQAPSGGGGIINWGAAVVLKHTLVVSSSTGSDCFGSAVTSQGYNLDSDNTCNLTMIPGDQPLTNPQLGPLADNGGDTPTHMPLPGSPLIDAVPPAACAGYVTDQRDAPRPGSFTTYCDTGAVEVQNVRPDVSITKSVTPALAAPGDKITYTLTFSNAGAGTATGVVITDSIPVSVTGSTVISSGVAITQTSPGYVWAVQYLAAGKGGIITITGVLSNPLAAGVFTNTATITTTAADGDASNNISKEGVDVQNVAPVATDNDYLINEDNNASGNVITDDTGNGIDSDANGDALTAALDDDVATGTLVLGSDGSFVYTPTLNWNGVVTFSYHASDTVSDSNTALVTITVDAVNDAPVATDNTYTTDEDVPVSGNVLTDDTGDGVDSDVDGDPLTATLDINVVTGTLALGSDGSFTYTPTLNYNGVDTFTYHADDGDPGNTATVTITVSAVNDPPVADDDDFTVDEDSTDNTLDVLDGDTDAEGDTLTISTVGDPDSSGAVVNGGTVVTYTPLADFVGDEVFTYTVGDGNGGTDTASVTVTVSNVNDPPVADDDTFPVAEDSSLNPLDVLDGDTDVDGDTLTITAIGDPDSSGTVVNGSTVITYTPLAGFSGDEVFTYTVGDGNGGYDTATVTVTVSNINNPPVADAGDNQSIATGATVTLDGSSSYDPDGNVPLSYSWVQTDGPAVTFTPNVSITTFTAPSSATALTFTLTVTDALGLPSVPDTVGITVTGGSANVAPVADGGGNQSVNVGEVVTLDGSGSSDPDGNLPLSYSWAQDGGPAVTFTPNLSITTFTAPTSTTVLTFTLTVTDALGLPSVPDTMVITVSESVNTPPVADGGGNQSVSTGATVTLDGSGSNDPDGNLPLTYSWAQTSGPAVAFTPNISVTVFTAPTSTTVLTFALVVTDALGLPSAPDMVVITVTEDSFFIYLPMVLKN